MPVKTEGQKLVDAFPAMFDQAVADLAKYKLARERGLVPYDQQQKVEGWFYEFPKLWGIIQPNWQWNADGSPTTGEKAQFAERVNRWVIRLRGEPFEPYQGLGIAPLLIAGILIAGAFGAAGLSWALGYMGEQRNISRIIDGVTAGKLPPDVLKKAVDQGREPIFGGAIKDALTVTLLVGAAFFLLPRIFKSTPPPVGSRYRPQYGD